MGIRLHEKASNEKLMDTLIRNKEVHELDGISIEY
jgi:hypothetical protein